MHRVPWWWPRFSCANKRCRDVPCVINDACWVIMSGLLMVLLLVYASSGW